MTLGEFYCKGLTAPVMVEIKRDDVVFARVYDIRGRSISSLLAIPAPHKSARRPHDWSPARLAARRRQG